MKTIFFCFAMSLWCVPALTAQDYIHPSKEDPAYLGESAYFRFYHHFWLNMHHFLYNRAAVFDGENLDAVFDDKTLDRMKNRDRRQLVGALNFYRQKMTVEDLRTGEYLFPFKRWVIQQANRRPLPDYVPLADHSSMLNDFARLYRRYFWKKHRKANQAVYKENIDLIRKLEGSAVDRLTALSQHEWQKEKIRVDLTYFSKLNRPFTTTRPATHLVMETHYNHQPKGNWFELLLHEASHHLIFPSGDRVGKTINEVAEEIGLERRAYREWWHVYLFYFSGKVAEALLEKELGIDYELYMVRNKVYHRSFPKADQYLPLYISGKESLLEVTRKILK